jgi:PEP-utilising enzyme, mobile domain
VRILGPQVVEGVANLTRRMADVLGDEAVEWAWVDDSPVLLQARAATPGGEAVPTQPVDARVADAMGLPAAEHLASWVTRFPGPLAESLVLPWAPGIEVSRVVDRPGPSADVRATLDEITRLVDSLATQAWGQAGIEAVRQALVDVREHRSATALRTLGRASPVDEAGARHLVAVLQTLTAAAATNGLAPDAAHVWRHDLRAVSSALKGQALPARRPDGPDPWEPFLHDFLRCRGTSAGGAPASPGVTTGWARPVDHPGTPVTDPTHGPRRREVLVAPYPMPALASLLWSASGLVTGPGDASAHLFEVARALRVPAVVDAQVERLRGIAPADHVFLAVDGTTGNVWARGV